MKHFVRTRMTLNQFIQTFCCEDTYTHITDSMEEETTTISYDGQIKEFIVYPDEHTTILNKFVESIDVCSDGYLLILLEGE